MRFDMDDLRNIYNMLEDEESKDIFLKRLNYSVTGDYKYIDEMVEAYAPEFSRKARDRWRASLPKDRDIVLYGTGIYATMMMDEWDHDKRIIGFCSGLKEQQGKDFLGYPVMSPEELLSRRDLTVVVNVVDPDAKEAILGVLQEGGYPSNQIFEVIPRWDPEQYFAPEFMKYEGEEVFVDAGCYDFGSSLKLQKYCNLVKKIYAFEPDPVNYQRCLEAKKKSNLTAVEIFPFGTWSERADLYFKSIGTGSSKIVVNGREGAQTTVPVIAIDEVIDPNDRVTMIKMDVEGAELESLKGARRTIQRDKPKLAICIYHKPEDVVEIPLYIKQLVPEYKLYIRHHSVKQTETVLYAVMLE